MHLQWLRMIMIPTSAVLLTNGCAGGTQSRASAPAALTMRYDDFMLDQPKMPTLEDFKKLLVPMSPQKSWAWEGGPYTVEHGPDHKLIVIASPQCQELAANTLLSLTLDNSSKFPNAKFPMLGSAAAN